MPLLPPNLERPFSDGTERAAAHKLLRCRDALLKAIETLARVPVDQWSSDQYTAFPHSTNGVPDPPPERLARWANIFGDELQEVHELAVRQRLDDAELRRALYFSGRLLATVTDLPIDMVDGFDLPRPEVN